jgi:serine/threonine-protein kinase
MHVELHEIRAIKFMLPDMLRDADSVERFLREARAAARLKSQHVAKVYDVGRLETGSPYIVMEYLEGTDLKTFSHQRGVLPVREAFTYMLQACEAVGEAHALGIIHRDLKPANMFLTTGVGGAPCVKVLDFGIAKLLTAGSSEAEAEITSTQMVMGSPLYMSPEQMRSARRVDARSDIWSLGIILYRLLAGVLPFQGESMPAIFAAVLEGTPSPPSVHNPALSAPIDQIVLRCLEKDPARRFQSVAELASALLPFSVDPPRASMPSYPESLVAVTSTQVITQSWSAPPVGLAPPPPSYPGAPPAAAATPGTGISWAQTRAGAPRPRGRMTVVAVSTLGGVALLLGAALLIASRLTGGAPASLGEPMPTVTHAVEPLAASPVAAPAPPSEPTSSATQTASERAPLAASSMVTQPSAETSATPATQITDGSATARALGSVPKPAVPAPTSGTPGAAKPSVKQAPPGSRSDNDPFGSGRF